MSDDTDSDTRHEAAERGGNTPPRAAVRDVTAPGGDRSSVAGRDWAVELTAPGGLVYRVGRTAGDMWAALATADGGGVALFEAADCDPDGRPAHRTPPGGVDEWVAPPDHVTPVVGSAADRGTLGPVVVVDGAVGTGGTGAGRRLDAETIQYPDDDGTVDSEAVLSSPGGAEYVVSATRGGLLVTLRERPPLGGGGAPVGVPFVQLHPEVTTPDAWPDPPDHLEVRPGEGAVAYVGDR